MRYISGIPKEEPWKILSELPPKIPPAVALGILDEFLQELP